jgi:hypothetical protein
MVRSPFAAIKQTRARRMEEFLEAVQGTCFDDALLQPDDKWDEESASAMMLGDLAQFRLDLVDLCKVVRLCEGREPRQASRQVLIGTRYLWLMMRTEPAFEDLRDPSSELLHSFLMPGAKVIKCIMQGGKTLKGMLLHSCVSAGLAGKVMLLFGHSGAAQVYRDLTSQVRWLQSIYMKRVYEPAVAAWERGAETAPSETWLPKKLVISSCRRGYQDNSPVGAALKAGRDPRVGKVQMWFNIWAGSGETPSAALAHMDELGLGEPDMYAVVDEAHLLQGDNKYHDDFRLNESRFSKHKVEITATPFALKVKTLNNINNKNKNKNNNNNNDDDDDDDDDKKQPRVVTLRPFPGYYCLRACYTDAEIEAYKPAGVHDVEYAKLEPPPALRWPTLATENMEFLLELFVPEKSREALRCEIDGVESVESKKLTELLRQRVLSVTATIEAASELCEPELCELPYHEDDGTSKFLHTFALVPVSVLVHNGFSCGSAEEPEAETRRNRHTQNCAHAQLSKMWVAENAKRLEELTQNETLDATFREEHSNSFILGFPDYMTSSVVRPRVDVFPGVHCNEAVVKFIKDNPDSLLEAFHDVCKRKSERERGGEEKARADEPRVQLLADSKYAEYEVFFSKFRDSPLDVVAANSEGATGETLLTRYAGQYALVYRVAFPKGCPLQVRKEIMYLLYCKSVNVNAQIAYTTYSADNEKLVDAVTLMRWRPLREMTVGKQLLRHSVAVTSLRSSLQPTHGIFAWDPAAKANLDDVQQGVGRINGKRSHTLHHEACYPGWQTAADRAPKLIIGEMFFPIVAAHASNMEKLDSMLPESSDAFEYSVKLGAASAPPPGEVNGVTPSIFFGYQDKSRMSQRLHVTQAKGVRQATDEGLRAGGRARTKFHDEELLHGIRRVYKGSKAGTMAGAANHEEEPCLLGIHDIIKPNNAGDESDESEDDEPHQLADGSVASDDDEEDDAPYCKRGKEGKPDVITSNNFKSWMLTVLPARNAKNNKNQTSVRAAVGWAQDNDLQLYTLADVAIALTCLDEKEGARDSANPLAGNLLFATKLREPQRFGKATVPRASVALWALSKWLEVERPGEPADQHAIKHEVLEVESWALFDSAPQDTQHADSWRAFLDFWRKRLGAAAKGGAKGGAKGKGRARALKFQRLLHGSCCFTGCDKDAGVRFCDDHRDLCPFSEQGLVCGVQVDKQGAKYCSQHDCDGQGCRRQRWFRMGSTKCTVCNGKLKCRSHACNNTRENNSFFCDTCKANKRSLKRKDSTSLDEEEEEDDDDDEQPRKKHNASVTSDSE